jgi:hypothetical protein
VEQFPLQQVEEVMSPSNPLTPTQAAGAIAHTQHARECQEREAMLRSSLPPHLHAEALDARSRDLHSALPDDCVAERVTRDADAAERGQMAWLGWLSLAGAAVFVLREVVR